MHFQYIESQDRNGDAEEESQGNRDREAGMQMNRKAQTHSAGLVLVIDGVHANAQALQFNGVIYTKIVLFSLFFNHCFKDYFSFSFES